MEPDFRDAMILLMQHPVINTPVDKLPKYQAEEAYDLVSALIDQALDDKFTQLDYIQFARLELLLAELGMHLGKSCDYIVSDYHSAFVHLERGGMDLSIKKWVELASIRAIDNASFIDRD